MEEPARTAVLSKGLLEAELPRHTLIQFPEREAVSHLDRDDTVVGPEQRLLSRQRRDELNAESTGIDEFLARAAYPFESLRIDVV